MTLNSWHQQKLSVTTTIEILVDVVQELEICKAAGDARMVQTTRTTGP